MAEYFSGGHLRFVNGEWRDDNGNDIEISRVRHGKWVIEMDDMGWLKHTCPNCGYVKRTDIHVSLGWNYCPNCGAKMDL